jgi:hypothetical protein
VAPTREVDDLVFGYGATGGAFAIDEGEVRVIVRGGASQGRPAEVESSPTGGEGRLYARVETASRDSADALRQPLLVFRNGSLEPKGPPAPLLVGMEEHPDGHGVGQSAGDRPDCHRQEARQEGLRIHPPV